MALELLLGLAESAAAMDGRRQATFVEQSLQPQAARVFHTLGQILQSMSMTEGGHLHGVPNLKKAFSTLKKVALKKTGKN